MKSDEIKLFCDVVVNYFNTVTSDSVEIGVPYVKVDDFETLSITGAIGISGSRKGCLFVTCSEEMIRDLARIVLMTDDIDDMTLYDMVGEFTNTIAGNSRQAFGPEFDISIPIIVKGTHTEIILQRLKNPVYIVPIKWRRHDFYLNLGID